MATTESHITQECSDVALPSNTTRKAAERTVA